MGLTELYGIEYHNVAYEQDGRPVKYRLFYYEPVGTAFDEALDWLKHRAERTDVIAATDPQWVALKEALGGPAWAEDPIFDVHHGRWENHDRLDAELRRWAAPLDVARAVERLVAAGVPAAVVADPRTMHQHPQLIARGFLEPCSHPIVGSHPLFSLPFRMTGVDHWHRSPAPTLGEHNVDILCGVLGLTEAEVADLEAAGIVGTKPTGL